MCVRPTKVYGCGCVRTAYTDPCAAAIKRERHCKPQDSTFLPPHTEFDFPCNICRYNIEHDISPDSASAPPPPKNENEHGVANKIEVEDEDEDEQGLTLEEYLKIEEEAAWAQEGLYQATRAVANGKLCSHAATPEATRVLDREEDSRKNERLYQEYKALCEGRVLGDEPTRETNPLESLWDDAKLHQELKDLHEAKAPAARVVDPEESALPAKSAPPTKSVGVKWEHEALYQEYVVHRKRLGFDAGVDYLYVYRLPAPKTVNELDPDRAQFSSILPLYFEETARFEERRHQIVKALVRCKRPPREVKPKATRDLDLDE